MHHLRRIVKFFNSKIELISGKWFWVLAFCVNSKEHAIVLRELIEYNLRTNKEMFSVIPQCQSNLYFIDKTHCFT